ncbi:BC_2427 family protein [Bacillus toyonensis]|uniref:BC_2427 family protein n=1 Tax=Bacillus toyonensis TaxID=155322 RepID=UPI00301B536A
MSRPWIGKGIWNKIYKEKKPNIQDDSYERRKKKEGLETESKQDEHELEKVDIETELEQVEEEHELEKVDIEAELEQVEEEHELEQEDVETELEKEEEHELEQEDVETESEKEEHELEQEDVETELEQEDVETELEQVEEEHELEQEDVETELEQVEEEHELEQEDVETESEKEEEHELEQEDVETELEQVEEEHELEQEDVETELEQEDVETESEKEDVGTESEIKSSVRSMVMKIPFSIVSEVSSFLKFPNISMKKQEAFVFQNEKNAGGRELDAKLLTTVQYYHGKAYCKLVSSNLHEKREFLEFPNPKVEDDIEKNRIEASSWIPIHSMILEKESEDEFNDYITVKLPIEIGRYKGEISLREKLVFKEKVTEIKDVSQEIILTKNEILLPKIKKTGQNPVSVEKAGLLVEGYIYQCIEYNIEQSTSHDNVYQLMQNIVLELTIQVLQEQVVRVRM